MNTIRSYINKTVAVILLLGSLAANAGWYDDCIKGIRTNAASLSAKATEYSTQAGNAATQAYETAKLAVGARSATIADHVHHLAMQSSAAIKSGTQVASTNANKLVGALSKHAHGFATTATTQAQLAAQAAKRLAGEVAVHAQAHPGLYIGGALAIAAAGIGYWKYQKAISDQKDEALVNKVIQDVIRITKDGISKDASAAEKVKELVALKRKIQHVSGGLADSAKHAISSWVVAYANAFAEFDNQARAAAKQNNELLQQRFDVDIARYPKAQ